MKKIYLILAVALVFVSCYRDNEQDLYPSTGTCDTNGVTYTNTVAPLLQSGGCMSCHSGAAPSGNISLSGYQAVRQVALNGKLYGAINHSPGFSPMPQGGNRMSSCNISKIKAWIDAGSLNN
jgi:hypothetical protein